MNKCVRCGDEYRMKDIKDGNVLIRLTGLHVCTKARDREAREKQCDILKEYGDGISLCPECSDQFLRWMKNPQAMYVEDYEPLIDDYREANKDLYEAIKDKNGEIFELKSKIKEYDQMRKTLQKQVNEMQEIARAVCEERDDALTKLDSANDEIEALKVNKYKLIKTIEQREEKLDSQACYISSLKENMEKLRCDYAACMDKLHATEDMLAEAGDYTLNRFKEEMLEELENAKAEDIKRFIVDTVNHAMRGGDPDCGVPVRRRDCRKWGEPVRYKKRYNRCKHN